MTDQASIYWRRRMVAISGVVVALVIIGWAAGGFFSNGAPPTQGTAGEVRGSQPPSSPPPPPPPSNSGTTSSSSQASATTAATSPPPPPPPDPNLPCPDAVMQLSVELGQPQYKVGQRPVLRLIVVNTGPVPCTRDVSRGLREIVVTSTDGATRLWSSNDCYRHNEPESQIVQAGERLAYEVQWAGRTSAPGCPARRATVRAGTYSVTGKLGPLTSPPVPLVLA
jgi:hypothetical protein